ncbi:WXG100 family type VII secretion target [Actinosynnema sp. CS-041913]|uniref:WXG100 family type VII secretion target n=1 Tax=Actinosynnema sp. CS-041913 TaxID=3239917 RepID=UPI003D8F424D
MNAPAPPQDATEAYTGIGIIEAAVDLHNGISKGSWVEGGLGVVSTGLEMLSLVVDPLGTLAQYAFSWVIEHCGPLRRWLDWLAGDVGQITAYAATWKNVSQAVGEAKADFRTEVANGSAGWKGDAGEAYRRAATKHVEYIGASGVCASTIGAVVEVVGALVGVVREGVRKIIADVVATLIVRVPQWAVMAAVTLFSATPAVAVQVETLVAKNVVLVTELTAKLAGSLDRLRPLMGRLTELWETIAKGLRGLRKTVSGDPIDLPDAVKQSGTTVPSTAGGGGGGGGGGGNTNPSDAAPPPAGGGGGNNPPPPGGGGGGSDTPPPPGGSVPPVPGGGRHPVLPRRPLDRTQPHPELTPAERQKLQSHHNELEAKHRQKFAETEGDPDHNGKSRKESRDEARIALDMMERGDLTTGYHRPSGRQQGDFIDEGVHWDIKGVHSDWPPHIAGQKEGIPYRDGYTAAKFEETLRAQFTGGRNVIVDTRNANAAAIEDMAKIVDREGWGGRVKWYP